MTKKDRIEMTKKMKKLDREWYSIRSLMGYSWAMLFFLLGGREAGKSYAVTDFYTRQFIKYGRPFYWLRLTEASAKKLLANNAEKLVDPDIRRRFKLELETRGDGVYAIRRDASGEIIEKKLMARVLALSTFYNDKGSGLFDKDFLNDPKMFYNIALDEMNKELNEKRTFSITYAFSNQLENLVRSTKNRIRVICIGNTLEEASDLLAAIDFLPEEFGRYKLKSKRAVVDYIEPTTKYLERRKGTIADIIAGDQSTFTNKVEVDTSLITGQRLIKPSYIIKFSKTEQYTVWDTNVVAPYHGETKLHVVAMRPYIDEMFNVQQRDSVIVMYDTRTLLFKNLITQKKFKKALELLKPRK